MENTPVRNVRLYGVLGAKFGRCFKMAVSTPAEAVQALCHQLPGFKSYLTQAKDRGMGFGVFVGKRNIGKEELLHPSGNEDIRIAPVMFGSKNGGWIQIIMGVILIIVGAVLSPFTGGASLSLCWAGGAMIAGGIVQLLMPVPKGQGGRDSADDNPSYAFNGPLNTQAQGHPVPLLYGELITGSAVVSAGITTDDNSLPNYGGGFGSRGGGGWISVVTSRVINDR